MSVEDSATKALRAAASEISGTISRSIRCFMNFHTWRRARGLNGAMSEYENDEEGGEQFDVFGEWARVWELSRRHAVNPMPGTSFRLTPTGILTRTALSGTSGVDWLFHEPTSLTSTFGNI